MLNNDNDKILRCAIYTRKSSEKGLELEYNSLEFQYNRCLEYIKSQPNLEFVKKYEDAGISGKDTKHRPGFLEMMRDVEARNIDCIIVYKLDRLSRSIVDLANLVEHLQNLDAHFISVTQQIDTSNSCGKLSFNMLAAIAQFEREIASERVRDKVASAKIQGLWCGGNVPFGYKAENKRLEIVEDKAEIVRFIFKEFTNGIPIYSIMKELQLKGVKTNKGKDITVDIVKHILENPIYIGKVRTKGLLYDGVHKAIIDYFTWGKTQQLLSERLKKFNTKNKKQLVTKNLLSGLIFCGECNSALTPVHTKKNNLLYRYYICQHYTKGFNKLCHIKRVAANQIEDLVIREIFKLLTSETMVKAVISQSSDYLPNELAKCCEHIKDIWNLLLTAEKRKLILQIINRINVYSDNVEIEIKTNGLENVISEALYIKKEDIEEKDNICITIPTTTLRARSSTKIIQSKNENYEIGDSKYFNPLIQKIAIAVEWRELLDSGKYSSLTELANGKNLEYFTVCKIYHLNYLAPDIIEYIANHQECCQNLTYRKLCRMQFPLLWQEQRELLLPMLKGEKPS